MEQSGTVEKALDVLFHLHEAAQPRGVTAIARCLGLPKSSVHRLLAALGRRGLVEQDAEGRYRLGFGLVALGLGMLEREPIVLAARPVLEVAAKALAETLFLTAAREGEITVLDKVEGPGFLRAAPRIGEKVPLHATAVGRLHLAFAPDLVALPEGPLHSFTPRTPTQRAAVLQAVALARRRGWAENREEWIPGLVVVAAPVLVGGRLVATVALAAPTVRLAARESGRVAQQLLAAAGHIGDRLQGRGERRTA
ncbi:MAG TPA: IclR family transcriptional regulator [Myxococcota bacterium]|nr:IclR family transcriptional regulator [Myxococcota bacterium]